MSSSESVASSSSIPGQMLPPSPRQQRFHATMHTSTTDHPDEAHKPLQNSSEARQRSQDIDAGVPGGAQPASGLTQEWTGSSRHTPPGIGESSAEQAHLERMSAQRKRRLTGPAQSSVRVRTASGGFHNRNRSSQGPLLEGPSSAVSSARQWHRPSSYSLSGDRTTNPVSRPLDPIRRRSSGMHLPMNTTQEYTLPSWQPDSEASKCPICSRYFTFWFRKHHCRKCGRVVCGSCSPHRITIPRQFIVQPPEPGNTQPTTSTCNPVLLDLTGETRSPPQQPPQSFTSPQRKSTSSLDDGDEVRLCNPCVPDPQPSPQALIDLGGVLRQGPRGDEVRDLSNQAPSSPPSRMPFVDMNLFGLPSPSDEARELRRRRGRGMIFQPEGRNLNPVRTNAEEIPEESLPAYGNFNYTVIPNYGRRDHPPRYRSNHSPTISPPGYSSHADSSVSALQRPHLQYGPQSPGILPQPPSAPPQSSPQSHLPAHSRYSSMDALARPPLSVSNRPRVRSMLDADASFRRFMDQAEASASSSSLPPRPQLQESDMCPVCRQALPPKGIDGDETARESHVMDCIAARDPAVAAASTSAHSRWSAQSPPAASIQMLLFTASEKDCVGEDGVTQECSICFVEYEMGNQLARLECLCKFHKACIMEWFSRKQECPVHKVV